MAKVHDLPIPEDMLDRDRRELLRLWLVDDIPFTAFAPMPEPDVVWGMLLADTIRHIAQGQSTDEDSRQKMIQKIVTILIAELRNPTSAILPHTPDSGERKPH